MREGKALENQSAKELEKAPLQSYVESTGKQKGLYKRTLFIIVIAQIFGGAGLAAGITVGALLAKDMLGTESFAGLPVALFTLGSAGAALLVGRISQTYGRRPGLALGFLIGSIGAVGVIFAAIFNSIILLFISLLIYGSGAATNLQSRYAGTDLATSKQRATAVSIALVSTTFGAVAGPMLVEVMGRFASSIGIPSLAGPFILAAIVYGLAGLIIFIFMRPDPLIISQLIAKQKVDENSLSKQVSSYINKQGVMLGASVMIVTQIVMVGIMTMTPVHMGHHRHGLNAIGLIIGIHVGSMYLPSLVTGILVDKVGRITMAIAAGITLLFSGILASVTTDSMWMLGIALALLGLGWNFGLISGTALLVDSTSPSNRAKTQGTVDVFIALAGAAGGVLSGVIVAYTSFSTLSITGGILSLLLIPVAVWYRYKTTE